MPTVGGEVLVDFLGATVPGTVTHVDAEGRRLEVETEDGARLSVHAQSRHGGVHERRSDRRASALRARRERLTTGGAPAMICDACGDGAPPGMSCRRRADARGGGVRRRVGRSGRRARRPRSRARPGRDRSRHHAPPRGLRQHPDRFGCSRPPPGAGPSGPRSAPAPDPLEPDSVRAHAQGPDDGAYVRRHYGSFMRPTWRLVDPHVIVIHYTESSYSSTYNTFATDVPDSELHELPATSAHFVIGTDGTIHQLVSVGTMARHTVGLNWTALGIEHVGYSDGQVLGDRAQMSSSLRLVHWLRCRFHIPVRDVIGHAESLSSPYHHEDVAEPANSDPWRFRSTPTCRSTAPACARSAAAEPRRLVELGRCRKSPRSEWSEPDSWARASPSRPPRPAWRRSCSSRRRSRSSARARRWRPRSAGRCRAGSARARRVTP